MNKNMLGQGYCAPPLPILSKAPNRKNTGDDSGHEGKATVEEEDRLKSTTDWSRE
jgi:hypothetical protein